MKIPAIQHEPDKREISRPLLGLFAAYSRWYLGRHFHSLRVSRAGLPPELDAPAVIYSNHAAWWDPLAGLMLSREFFAGKKVFAPMDAVALERYGFFKKLGAFGVEQGKRRGAVQFLRTARSILQEPDNILWLTPQSRFADVRERPARFKSGIGHLPGCAARICFLPVAMEYTFWEECLPEILVRCGEPREIRADDARLDAAIWTDFFASQLTETQNALAAEARARKPERFVCLLRGGAGVGGVYDVWRALKAKWRGQEFKPEHGTL